MAHDVFVRWKAERQPTREEAETVIRDFLGPVATEVKWDRDRFFITLMGSWSNPLAHVGSKSIQRRLAAQAPEGETGRYMEVWLSTESLDVITRQTDSFTRACQDGLARTFARGWEGTVE